MTSPYLFALILVGTLAACNPNPNPDTIRWKCHVSDKTSIAGELSPLPEDKEFIFSLHQMEVGPEGDDHRQSWRVGEAFSGRGGKFLSPDQEIIQSSRLIENSPSSFEGFGASADYIASIREWEDKHRLTIHIAGDHGSYSDWYELDGYFFTSLVLYRRGAELTEMLGNEITLAEFYGIKDGIFYVIQLRMNLYRGPPSPGIPKTRVLGDK